MVTTPQHVVNLEFGPPKQISRLNKVKSKMHIFSSDSTYMAIFLL
jgi:hypothetical protein